MKRIDDALKPVSKCRKEEGKLTSVDLKDKLGDNMLS